MLDNSTVAVQVPSATASQEPTSESSALGGSDPHRFDWHEAWHPIAYISDLDVAQPNPFTLLGQDLVIWWDPQQSAWTVFEDRCPHRLARFSEGRVTEDGLLECPYHGWTFSGDGQCQYIPQQVEGQAAETSSRACVQSLPTAMRQGLLFVYLGNPECAAQVKVPIIEPLEEGPDEWVCLNTFRDLPYDALTLLENVLDPSHLPYTHHRSVGDRANASPVELEVVKAGKAGFDGLWAEGPRRGKLGPQDTRFIAPGLMWHEITSEQYGRTVTAVYAVPTKKGHCRLFARFPFKFKAKAPGIFMKLTPQWYNHINQNNILEDDQIFLHHQERYLEQSGGSGRASKAFYLPTKADTFVKALHQWVNQFEADPFAGESLPPALPKHELLDRYYSHTVNCPSCRGALKNIKRLRLGVGVLGVSLWGLSPLIHSGVFVTVPVALCGAAWWGLKRLEKRFYEGRAVPLRNLPDS
ncbi:Pheophorbide a oxygenase [Acaryochloris thomasi RCC1774]|uniref:Pheophorbide a oxygenase n=1 Tax=Acaryochloris thomasi RCC1774 TaxID=1764569 RepID=A0A2W1JUH0_9CYAN|nr:Rieske 2Fe-2S domain-containing protein [Acaryochloris thomasi]PZD74142.1 Pheophorbide a oxygenase [Acaryochloris thomasi RCC1774]